MSAKDLHSSVQKFSSCFILVSFTQTDGLAEFFFISHRNFFLFFPAALALHQKLRPASADLLDRRRPSVSSVTSSSSSSFASKLPRVNMTLPRLGSRARARGEAAAPPATHEPVCSRSSRTQQAVPLNLGLPPPPVQLPAKKASPATPVKGMGPPPPPGAKRAPTPTANIGVAFCSPRPPRGSRRRSESCCGESRIALAGVNFFPLSGCSP